MNRDAKGVGRADDEAQGLAAEQVPGIPSREVEAAGRKMDQDAEWQSMTTGDPALYLKDLE